MSSTRVLVADANSTDGTPEIVLGFRDRLNVAVIPGGMPAVGRNRGAALADTPFVLFCDADVEMGHPSVIRRAVDLARKNHLHCVTTNVLCPDGGWFDKIVYLGNDIFQQLSRLHKPFATGMFMLFDRKKFFELGGFHEQAQFAEDYLLSQRVSRNRFGIVFGGVYTTNRRFEKMGHWRVMRLFFRTAFNYWNQSFYLRDHKYWAHLEDVRPTDLQRPAMAAGPELPGDSLEL